MIIHSYLSGWKSIIHFTEGENNAGIGHRVPAILTRSERVVIGTTYNDIGNQPHYIDNVETGKWISVIISQTYNDEVSRYHTF